VPDLEAAVRWYCEVFGLEPITGNGEIDARDGGPITELCVDIFGAGFGGMKLAHLASANGVAIELFEFLEPAYEAPENSFAYWRGGIFHFAFVAKDAEHLVAVIERNGGSRLSKLDRLFEGRPLRACYCQDPWGTVIEVISESHERAFANVGEGPPPSISVSVDDQRWR
jgi:catechol 2,3-dioxygenase-like lactoylglutathione lyase family enzyme